MGKDLIICPNCGAENEYGGTCQYCGSLLFNSSSGITLSENYEDNNGFIEDKYGLFRQSYDKFKSITQSVLEFEDLGKLGDEELLKVINKERTHLCLVRIKHSNGNIKDYLRFTNLDNVKELMLLLDDRKKITLEHNNNIEIGPNDYYISKDILYEICHCHKLEGRIRGKDEDLSFFIPGAQLFYNRLYDSSEYLYIYEEALKKKANEYRRLIYQLRKKRYCVINGNIRVDLKYKKDIVLSFNSWNIREELYINGQSTQCLSRTWDSTLSKFGDRFVDFYINKGILEEFCNANSIAIVCRDSICDPFYIEDVTYIIKPLARIAHDELYENSLKEKTIDELYDLVEEEKRKNKIEKEKQIKYENEKKEKKEKRKKELYDSEIRQKVIKRNIFSGFYLFFLIICISSVIIFLYSGYKIYALGEAKMGYSYSDDNYKILGDEQTNYWIYIGVSFVAAYICHEISNAFKKKRDNFN